MDTPGVDTYVRKRWAGMRCLVHPHYLEYFPPEVERGTDCKPVGPIGPAGLPRRGRRTRRIPAAWGSGRDVIAKEYGPRSRFEHAKYAVCPTRAVAEWRMSLRLRAAGLPAATPLAFGERRVCGVWRRSLLVVEAVQPGTTLEEQLRRHPCERSTSDALRALAAEVAKLHDSGFHYRDLHPGNVLLRACAGGRMGVCFVDLHEVRHVGCVSRGMAVDDLGRLNAYAAGALPRRQLFLRRYLAARGIAPGSFRSWVHDVDAATRAIWERHFRKRGTHIETYE